MILGELIASLQYLKGPIRKMGTVILAVPFATGQGTVVINKKREI